MGQNDDGAALGNLHRQTLRCWRIMSEAGRSFQFGKEFAVKRGSDEAFVLLKERSPG